MTKVYVLFYDYENGNDNENWSTFYTPCEVFTDPVVREARKTFIETTNPALLCELLDVDVSTVADGPIQFNQDEQKEDEDTDD